MVSIGIDLGGTNIAVGAVSLAEAEYRDDVTVHANRELLAKVFRRKPIYVGDHF